MANIDISTIGGKLADHIASLSAITDRVGDKSSTYTLGKMEPRMRQGLVRVAVIGVTSTGKSTAINALVNTLALPENPSVSTPIPVWIGYQKGQGSTATIYKKEEDRLSKETCDLPTFMRKYCYNIKDIVKKDRSRYDNVAFGAVNTESSLLENGIVLIDTLGISATTVDSRKTIRVLKEGVDAVIFLTKNSNLNMEEKRFLYQYVLGCRDITAKEQPEEAPVSAVLPENLFIVHNDWMGNVSKVAFNESVRVLYENSDMELDDDDIDDLVDNNVFYINAYKARLGSLGVYPYEACAPEGSTEAALSSMKKREASEQSKLAASDAKQLFEESGIKALADAVRAKGMQLCKGKNSVAVRRINELLPIVDGVIQAADDRLGNINISIANLAQKKAEFAKIESVNKTERDKIANAIKALNKEYKSSFEKLVGLITPDLKTACKAKALGVTVPDNFQDVFQSYKKMDAKAREDYLKELLPDVIADIDDYCTGELIKALDSSQAAGFDTPFAVMLKVEKLISNQEVLLNGYIDALRELGAEELGAALPARIVVSKLYEELKLDIEEKIKEIIANACNLSGERFKSSMQNCVKKCKVGFFRSFLPGAADKLWENITKELFAPLAIDVVDGMSDYTVNNIFEKTMDAFDDIKMSICESHIRLFISVEKAISELEQQGVDYGNRQNQAKTAAAEIKAECDRIKNDILAIQYELMHS